jgi:DNA-binding beta-propeller fold protein YncE
MLRSTCARAVTVGCAAVLLALSLSAPAAAGAESHPFLFSVSKFTVAEPLPPHSELLEDPCGVALDSQGDIYVADYYHDQIAIFEPSGGLLTRITAVDPGDGPCALAVAADGDLYINDYHRDVVRLTPSQFPPRSGTTYGERLQIDPGPATGLALDPGGGNLLIDERTRIVEREPSGAPVRSFGEVSLGSGYGVAASGFPATLGDVYVADAATDTVKVFAPSGALSGTVDGAGTPQGGFASLVDSALAVDDSDGHLFVTDNLQDEFFEHPRATLDEFNSAGAYRGGLPEFPTILAGEPSGLAIDNSGGASQGDVYLTSGNSEAASVGVYGPTAAGQTLEVTKVGAGEGTVASAPAGIDCGSACLAEYDAGSEVILTATPAAGSAFSGWSGCPQPSGPTCTVTLATDQSVGAEFEPAPEPLAFGAAQIAPSSPAPAAGTSPPPTLSLRQQSVGADSVAIEVDLPGSGTISAGGSQLRLNSRQAGAGATRLRLHLDRRGVHALARRKDGELSVALQLSFTPTGEGTSLDTTGRIVFRSKRRGGAR